MDKICAGKPVARAELKFTNQFYEITRLRNFITGFLEKNPPTKDNATVKAQIVLVVHEVASNIVRHGADGCENLDIVFSVEKYPRCIKLEFIHNGKSFRPDQKRPKPVFDGTRESGFGLYIIDQVIDRSTYTIDENQKNHIILEKQYF